MAYETFRLWEERVPGAQGTDEKDIPSITVYPAKAGSTSRPAMVVLPGGGYRFLTQHEGPAYAEWLSENGFTSFLVKYRLAVDAYRYPCMLWDAARAVRWVRAHAAEYAIDPLRVGRSARQPAGICWPRWRLIMMMATRMQPTQLSASGHAPLWACYATPCSRPIFYPRAAA